MHWGGEWKNHPGSWNQKINDQCLVVMNDSDATPQLEPLGSGPYAFEPESAG